MIITSDYFDEGISAYKVGLMHEGTVLIEDKPNELLNKFQVNSFEQIIINMCQRQTSPTPTKALTTFNMCDNHITDICSIEKSHLDMNSNCQNSIPKFAQWPCNHQFGKQSMTFHLSKIISLINRNFIKLKRNFLIFLMFIILPSIQMGLFCLTIGSPIRHLKLSIFNDEKPPYLTRLFLKSLSSGTITQIQYNDFHDAIKSVNSGLSFGAILLPKSYSNLLIHRLYIDALNDTQNNNIKLYLDKSNPILSHQILFSVIKSFYTFINKTIEHKLMPRKRWTTTSLQLLPPIKLIEIINGDLDWFNLSQYYIYGYILVTIFIVELLLTILLLIREQNNGLIERCLATGTSTMQIILAHLITQLILLFIQELLIVFVVWMLNQLDIRTPGLSLGLILIYLNGVSGICFGLLIASISPNPVSSMILSSATFLPSIILSGLIWPTESMPTLVMKLSDLLPLTLPIESLRSILMRKMNLSHSIVKSGFAISIIYSLFMFILSVIIFKRRKLF